MKKRTIKFSVSLLSLAFVVALSSCAKFYGEPLTKDYPVDGNYTKIAVSHAFDVTVSDEVTDAVVTMPEELHGKLKLETIDGILYIGLNSRVMGLACKCRVILPANPQVKDLDLSGASSFRGDLQGTSTEVEVSGSSEFYGNITSQKVEIDLSGSSEVWCTVDADKMEVEVSGASDANINGTCTGTMDIDVSGSSTLRAAGLNTDAVKGELSGSSDADVTVCNRIAVKVSGASDLTYGLSAPECRPEYRCTTSGSSNVTPRY